MKRYTVMIIDHERGDALTTVETDSLNHIKKQSSKVKPQKSNNAGLVYPNYERASEILGANKNPTKLQRFQAKGKQPEDFDAKKRSAFEVFNHKMETENYEKFTPRDLVCFFSHVAQQQGIKYAINWARDVSVMRRLRESLDVMDIVAMIEFLFQSDQDYLDPRSIGVTILGSNWMNTIYQDSQLWLDEKYVPKRKKSKKQREWTEKKPEKGTESTVGWE